jgi:hypothetical protein
MTPDIAILSLTLDRPVLPRTMKSQTSRSVYRTATLYQVQQEIVVAYSANLHVSPMPGTHTGRIRRTPELTRSTATSYQNPRRIERALAPEQKCVGREQISQTALSQLPERFFLNSYALSIPSDQAAGFPILDTLLTRRVNPPPPSPRSPGRRRAATEPLNNPATRSFPRYSTSARSTEVSSTISTSPETGSAPLPAG